MSLPPNTPVRPGGLSTHPPRDPSPSQHSESLLIPDQPGHAIRPPAGVWGQLGSGVLSRTNRCCRTETEVRAPRLRESGSEFDAGRDLGGADEGGGASRAEGPTLPQCVNREHVRTVSWDECIPRRDNRGLAFVAVSGAERRNKPCSSVPRSAPITPTSFLCGAPHSCNTYASAVCKICHQESGGDPGVAPMEEAHLDCSFELELQRGGCAGAK